MSSTQHKALTARCPAWLCGRTTGRGMRSGYEVPLANGYVADWVGLCGMQSRFRRRYVPENMVERQRWSESAPPQSGIEILPEFACVFETKVSMADFLSTFAVNTIEKRGRGAPIGSLHWVVIPKSLQGRIPIQELAPHWGVLVVAGGGLHEVRIPVFHRMGLESTHRIAYHILWYGKETAG